MSTWDEPLGSTEPQDKTETPPKAEDKLHELMKEYRSTQGLIDSLKEKADLVKEEILDFFPTEPGHYDRLSGDGELLLEVTISEKWRWDDRKLEEIIAEKELPHYIKRKLSIDRRRFSRLDPDEKDLYLDALTREPGLTRIRVKALPKDEQQG